jgi:hypothetical protein
MPNTLNIKQVEAIESVEPAIFQVWLLLDDGSEAILKMDGAVLCSLADMASQYATA